MKGFSLVELSIVLVILGLLTGGILGGQSLIHAAELRSVAKEAEQFTTAIYTFRTKYMGLPGDLPNATAFWGAEPLANCPGDESTPSTTPATCNGNGNGEINWHNDAGLGGESHRFWQHLANAGLINGQFTGTHSAGGCNGNGSCNVTLGVNAPKSKFGAAGWSVYHVGSVGTGELYFFPGKYGNIFQFGTVGNFTSLPALKPADAWNVDQKLDDGRPSKGYVRSWKNSYSADCADSDNEDTAVYQLELNTIGCQMTFLSRF